MSTVRQLIEDDITQGIFAAPEWAEPVTQVILGVPLVWPGCFVDRWREEGTNENQIDGSGRELENLEGKRIRISYIVDLPNAATVSQGNTFIIDGESWSFVRVLGRDSSPNGRQTILVTRVDPTFTRAPRLRGVGSQSRGGAMG